MLEETVANFMLIPPKLAKYPAIEDALWINLQKGYKGECSVKDALTQAAEKINQILS